jgi:hypothetical protein
MISQTPSSPIIDDDVVKSKMAEILKLQGFFVVFRVCILSKSIDRNLFIDLEQVYKNNMKRKEEIRSKLPKYPVMFNVLLKQIF